MLRRFVRFEMFFSLIVFITVVVMYSRVKHIIGIIPFILACLFWYTFVSPVNIAIILCFMGNGIQIVHF